VLGLGVKLEREILPNQMYSIFLGRSTLSWVDGFFKDSKFTNHITIIIYRDT
jgi:hypothetical protein